MKKSKIVIICIITVSIFSLIYKSQQKEVINIDESPRYVYPLGEIINIKADTCGVLVIGYEKNDVEPINELKIGDTILKIDNIEINDISQIDDILEKSDEYVEVLVQRDKEYLTKNIKVKTINNEKRLGVWVRNKISGVGTLTFYDVENNKFYALGHPILDSDTDEMLDLKQGQIYRPSEIMISKANENNIGEIQTDAENQLKIGEFEKNLNYGISGKMDFDKGYRQLIQIAQKQEVVVGDAYIIFEDKNRNINTYDIKIEKIDYINDKMSIKIVDEKLINLTGGIIRGMSGSPICQNEKLIGALGYVDKNDSTVGYGIFIENMLE